MREREGVEGGVQDAGGLSRDDMAMAGLSPDMARNSKQTSSQLTELTVGKKTFVRQGGKKS